MTNADDAHANLFSLEGRVALVTGGSKGLGYMMSQGLLQAGARVYITARSAQECAHSAASLSAFGSCHALPGNITNEAERARLVASLRDKEGRLDILVNNAGTSWGDNFETYPDAAFAKVFDINVTALFAMTRDCADLLQAAATDESPARVVNIGSIDGLHIPTVHRTGTFAYTASKAAVHHLTRHLALELGERHITVNAVAPGFFPSKMTQSTFEKFGDDLANNSLLKRVGRPSDIAGTVVYLCSRAGAYTHGTVIPVDGGTSINYRHVSDE